MEETVKQKSSSSQLVSWIVNQRIAIIIVTAAITLLFIYGNTKIYIDNDTMKSVPETLKEKKAFMKLQQSFPTPFTLIFMASFEHEQGGLLEKCDSIAAWASLFEKITVDNAPGIINTIHINTIKVPIKGGFLGLSSEDIIPPKKELSEQHVRERINEYSEFTRTFVSEDEKVLGIVLSLNPDVNRPRVIEQVVNIVNKIDADPTIKTYLTGATSTSFFLSQAMRKDFSILLPICLLIASLLLYCIFRKVLYVVSSLFIIAVAIVWTFGIMGLIGVPFSVVTSVIPIILFPVGVANAIHILKTYSGIRWQKGNDFIFSFSETYRELIRPIILTSVTTFIGFGSFMFSEISWTRYFGLFTGIGVILSLLLTVILLPIFLYYEPKSKKICVPGDSVHGERSFSISFLDRYRKLIFESRFTAILLILVVLVCIVGGIQVRFESNPISMFSSKSTIRQSDELIAKYFGGTRFFYVLLTSKQKLTNQSQWSEVDAIVEHMRKNKNVGDVTSILPLLKRTSTLLNNEAISDAGISLLVKSKGLFGRSFKKLVDSWMTDNRQTVKLALTCKNIPGFKYTKLADEFEHYIRTHYPQWDVQIAGPALLIDSMITLLIKTQVSSITIAFASVFLVLSLLFRSWKIGLFSTIPMILSTACVYALMGLMGVAVNMVTVVIVNTCIGIGIDYSIHFTAGYMFIRGKFTNNVDALMQTVKNKGAVIMFNTFVVGAGFFVLVFSSFPPIRNFGFFIFLSMFISSTFALIFLPVFLKHLTVTK